MDYIFEISRFQSKKIEVSAESPEEAFKTVKEKWKNGTITFDTADIDQVTAANLSVAETGNTVLTDDN